MASDYASIRSSNERRYGTDIGRIGPMLFADRYDDRTHFIFELLQNAEDALARRYDWKGSRAVNFHMVNGTLRVSHYGKPFDEHDVRGICGIAESTKDVSTIGRFGIGFKSVYAFTDRPEVHSGEENFAIEKLVWPIAAPVVDLGDDETVIVLPLQAGDDAARDEITRGLQRLGPRTLLFLRQIDEIAWTVDDGPSGLYLRSKLDVFGEKVRRISVIGEADGRADVEEAWLIFSREVKTPEGSAAGYVEIAFSIAHDEDPDHCIVNPVSDSPLVVFFPTVLPTYLGFLVQGPYRTTPSRDNVRRNDPWNQYLVRETASLLVEALHWMRDSDMLDTAALRCMPIDRGKFGESSMFAPLFEATRQALTSEPLLPRFGGGYVAATDARLAITQDLRELLGPGQLAALYGHEEDLFWLSGDITQVRTPELRQYVMGELDVMETTPKNLLPKLNSAFLEPQTDDWLRRLYEFLNGQPALLRQGLLGSLPVVRLESGEHVVARSNGEAQAFLPSAIETGFPTVRRTVCNSDDARQFLQSLGLTEPDPVDDIIRYVLPKYRGDEEESDIDNNEYEADIRRILKAFATDSKVQRDKLIGALRQTAFVMAVDAGDRSMRVSKPADVYLATERLKELFAGVAGVLLVDDSCACLTGEDVRDLLVACGATRVLQPIATKTDLTSDELREIRRKAGLERSTGWENLRDFTVRGLQTLLEVLPQLDVQARRQRAGILWEALADLESRRGSRAFLAEYSWSYFHESKTAPFDAAFVRQLNATAWVPDSNGEPQRPVIIDFETLDWKPDPFLQSKICFKPQIIETLEREAGFEPGVLDLLKKRGVTTVAELLARLGDQDEPTTEEGDDSNAEDDDSDQPAGSASRPVPDQQHPASGGGVRGSKAEGETTASGDTSQSVAGTTDGSRSGTAQQGTTRASTSSRAPVSKGSRPFISYVGVHPDEDESDPDGLDHKARMGLEAMAIRLVLAQEPDLERTPLQNPGFDLFETGEDGQPVRWIEIKAMTGCLNDRPVGLSHTQFECAREHGSAYWLYVVEHAGNDENARIVRIQDPAGRARTFTFDRGWIEIAEVDGSPN